MKTLFSKLIYGAMASLVFVLAFQTCWAQEGPNRRLFGLIASPQLAKLDEVSKELKLSDEQKKQVDAMIQDMMGKFGQAFQDAAGDFAKMGVEIRKLQTEAHSKLLGALDDSQKGRIQQIYAQVNRSAVLLDKSVIASLKISEDQQKKIEKAQQESQQTMFESFGEWQTMSSKDRAIKAEELITNRDKTMAAPLTDDQKAEFEKSMGTKLEINLSKIPMPGQ